MSLKDRTETSVIKSASTKINKVRTGLGAKSLKAAVTKMLFYQQGHNVFEASLNDVYLAVWVNSQEIDLLGSIAMIFGRLSLSK